MSEDKTIIGTHFSDSDELIGGNDSSILSVEDGVMKSVESDSFESKKLKLKKKDAKKRLSELQEDKEED